MVLKRFTITMINIFCTHSPSSHNGRAKLKRHNLVHPLAVMLLADPQTDILVSCLLSCCAVIPAHMHGFYISWVYFYRKREVRRGLHPGGQKTFIYSNRVLSGGASNRVVEGLKQDQLFLAEKRDMFSSSGQGPTPKSASDKPFTQKVGSHRPS